MADYSRIPTRFFYKGISLLPQDALAEGKVGYALNVRSYQEGTVGPRYGLSVVTDAALPSQVHSLFRLNDDTPFGESSNPARRIVGSGTAIYGGDPGLNESYAEIDTGYSGDPLTGLTASPVNSPRPWLYLADSDRMRKVNTSLTDYPIGIPTPVTPPTALLDDEQTTYLETMTAPAWVDYGEGTGAADVSRISAVVTQLIYDSGSSGMASVALDDMAGVVSGTTIDIGASPLTVIVREVIPPVSSTTVGRILYDSGTSGLCTIQPAGSFTVGQIEAALPDEIRRRYEDLNLPIPPRVTVSRTVDFPVNGLVLLDGSDVVRILSVALGPDGIQSFRCSTSATISNGDAIDGIACFRAWFASTRNVADPADANAVQNTLTAVDADTAAVGGIQAPMSGGDRNWGLVGTVASQPSDIIRIGMRVSAFAYLQSVRLLLNLSDDGGGGADFLHNYYFYEWRANDLLSAVQASAGAATGLMADAQADAVTQGETDALYGDQYGQLPAASPSGIAPAPGPTSRGIAPPSVGIGPRSGQAFTDSFVTAGSTPSRQLSLGDDQWVMLQCRVSDLTRVGTDATKTLSNINAAAYVVQMLGTTDTVTFQFADGYLTGGYGPDVGNTLPPIVYRYRYRSTITGERSNPSPPMRSGMLPHRGRVVLRIGEVSAAPQTDVVDWFRFGGALARWQYTGTQATNTIADFNDDNADTEIDGGETLNSDLFQPWPSHDIPKSGVGILAGTALLRTSGDTFDTDWGANSIILVNGHATTLYRPPTSTTRVELVDNCGEDGAVAWSLPEPLLLGQPSPVLWGGPVNNVWFHFGCGDPNDPGVVRWTYGNDPDTTSERYWLAVSSGSEPLQNGYIDDGVPYVFSTERLYRLVPSFGDLTTFRAVETNCEEGLWGRWAFCKTPYGIFFVTKRGISVTSGGAASKSITDPDLKYLFPQDDAAAQLILSFEPVDMTNPNYLRLSWVDGYLYFDYMDDGGDLRTLVYEPQYQRWTPDIYAKSGVTVRASEPGQQVSAELLGCYDGNIYQVDSTQFVDDDEPIDWALWPPLENGSDPRIQKQWGDCILDCDPGDTSITVIPVSANGSVAAPTVTVTGSVRALYIVEIDGGDGVLSQNIGIHISGASSGSDTQRPVLYLWEPSFVPKNVTIARRATDWEDLGYKGAKFVQGVVLRANTFNVSKAIEVQYDGGTVALTLQATHDGEETFAYPLASAGWSPFVAELVRLQGADDDPWILLDWRWVWEPAPEIATQWETQPTTFDLPGYMSARDGVIAYQSTAAITLNIWHDSSLQTYTLPTSSGVYTRYWLNFVAQKGKSLRFQLTSTEPFRLFKRDLSIRLQGWGIPGGFQVVNPFGGPSRISGAEI